MPILYAVSIVGLAAVELSSIPNHFIIHGAAFSAYFFAGSLLAHATFRNHPNLGVAICCATAVVGAILGLKWVSVCPIIAVAVVSIGTCRSPRFLQPPRDISYGVYLYAWPMQQLTAYFFMPFPAALAFSVVSVFSLAVASNVFVEVPALRLKELSVDNQQWQEASQPLDCNAGPQ